MGDLVQPRIRGFCSGRIKTRNVPWQKDSLGKLPRIDKANANAQMYKYTLVRLEMTLLVSQSSAVGVLWLVHSSDCVCPHEKYTRHAPIYSDAVVVVLPLIAKCCLCTLGTSRKVVAKLVVKPK